MRGPFGNIISQTRRFLNLEFQQKRNTVSNVTVATADIGLLRLC